MPYPPSEDWRMGLVLDRHDDPHDTEQDAADALDEQERREQAWRDER